MKTIVIWDIHGRNIRKKIVNQDFDKVIFVWDYFDSFDISIADQIQNFKDILEFRDAQWMQDKFNKVCLLCGNHDWHYMSEDNTRWTGYSPITAIQVKDLLNNAWLISFYDALKSDMTVLYRISHAWYTQKYANEFLSFIRNFDFDNAANHIEVHRKTMNNLDWPLRIRPEELNKDLPDFKQVFWHTQIDNIILWDNINVDCLHNWQYLVIENGTVSVQFI